ncbi:hemerythrin domain-containing protein [Nocardia sp. NBC_01009]|uniref:hemerythrin domain-containing protein n=1 Tax=Nocardia sp. NBC_01009 TaxID=2975996 RepID=UPI0038699EC8|nr:hemerythrin domain-containing protein [Nocardia sp. NBC_01009]
MSATLDMTTMYAMHHALRRELEQIAKITSRIDDDPRKILSTAAGWRMFTKSLHIHHTAEDDALWPVMRETLAQRPSELALLDAMEAEHGAVDPLIEAIEAAFADRESGSQRLGDLVDALVTVLVGHLEHEEKQALPLIQATVTLPQWQAFGQLHGSRIGPDAPQLIPWLLDGADERTVDTVLAPLLEPVRAAYFHQWQPAYIALDRWSADTSK